MRRILSDFSCCAILCLMAYVPLAATAQGAMPTSIVIPAPPGGASDMLARLVAMKLAPIIGNPVIVENRPGANSIIGISRLVRNNQISRS